MDLPDFMYPKPPNKREETERAKKGSEMGGTLAQQVSMARRLRAPQLPKITAPGRDEYQ